MMAIRHRTYTSEILALHAARPELSAIAIAELLDIRVSTVRGVACQHTLHLPLHRQLKPREREFRRFRYAGQEDSP